MASPVVNSITFDKSSYVPGNTITVTVNYSNPNNAATSYTIVGTVTDNVTSEVGTLNGSYTVQKTDQSTVTVTGGESGQTWTKVSDNGASAVFTALAS